MGSGSGEERPDRYTWKPGDVEVHDSVKALRLDAQARGGKLIFPQKRRLRKEDRETE